MGGLARTFGVMFPSLSLMKLLFGGGGALLVGLCYALVLERRWLWAVPVGLCGLILLYLGFVWP